MPTTVKNEQREQSAAERNAIKGSYKQIEKTIAYKDLVKHAETCYNTYMEDARGVGNNDIRISLLDRATAWHDLLEYLKRQVS